MFLIIPFKTFSSFFTDFLDIQDFYWGITFFSIFLVTLYTFFDFFGRKVVAFRSFFFFFFEVLLLFASGLQKVFSGREEGGAVNTIQFSCALAKKRPLLLQRQK